MKTLFSILFSATLLVSVAQQPTPAPTQKKSVLLLYATAHIGTGEVINQSVIGFRDGVIDFVGNALTANLNELKYDTTINLKGKHIYPGFIGLNSTIGLVEIEAVRASVDNYEVGEFNPAVRSLIAYNTDSEIQPTVRTNGVLMAQITPRGGTVTGTSSVVHFDAWNWEDAALKTDDGVHLNWPSMYRKSGWWAEPGETKRSENYDKQKQEIVDYFKKAKAYYETKNNDFKDLNMEAMKGVFNGSKKLYVSSDFVKEIQDIITFKKEMGLQHVVLVGGYDAWMVAPQLKENNMAVVLQRVHSIPTRPEDDVDLPYKLPKLLQDAGVLFCLQNAGDMEQMGLRNLPFYAGTARAYGLTEEQAIAAVSYNAARILGIDNKVGSLQKGKDATFFISDGDALDMKTNNIILAYIQGRKISLTNRQIELYEKYKTKYGITE